MNVPRFAAGFWCCLLLATAGAQTGLPDGPPKPLQPPAPEYPAALKEQRITGSADILCQIDEKGDVREAAVEFASLEEFGRAAAEAVRRAKFQPAIRGGKAIAVRVRIPIEFGLTASDLAELDTRRAKETLPPGPMLLPAAEVDELPDLEKEIRPATPEILRRNRRSGQVLMAFIVDEHGRPRDVHAVVTTDSECSVAAMKAIGQWNFKPGRKNGQVVRVAIEVPVFFSPENTQASGLRVRPGVSHEIIADYKGEPVLDAHAKGLTVPPKAIHRREPDYPEEMLGRSKRGEATVEFIINPAGLVTHVQTNEATNEYFAVAAERAISYWRFKPAMIDGKPVFCHALQKFAFTLSN